MRHRSGSRRAADIRAPGARAIRYLPSSDSLQSLRISSTLNQGESACPVLEDISATILAAIGSTCRSAVAEPTNPQSQREALTRLNPPDNVGDVA